MAYDSGDKLIKKIQVGDTPHEIDAKYFNGHKWSEVTALVAAGFTIETPWTKTDYDSATAPTAAKLAKVPAVAIKYSGGSATGTLAASGADTKKHIYLIYHPHSLGLDSYDEYVSVGTGDAAKWELIGNTDIDLSSYAKKGTYTSGGPSSNATGEAGAATITSSSAGSQTATGTASVSYQKSAAVTGSANGSTASNTGTAGGVTISGSNFKFNGTQATITLSNDAVSIPSHEYTPEGSIGGSQAIAAHTHTVNVAKAILNILCAPLLSPTATLSDTNFEIALGTPIDDIVSNNAYIWYPLAHIPFPLSPKPCLFVRYNVYTKPKIFIRTCENISVITPCMNPSFLGLLFISRFLLPIFIILPPTTFLL